MGAWRGWEHGQMWVTEGLWDVFRGVDFTPSDREFLRAYTGGSMIMPVF